MNLRFLALVVPALLLSTVAHAQGEMPGAIAAVTLAGEQCRTQIRADLKIVGSAPADADLICAGKTVGRLAHALVAGGGGGQVIAPQAALSAAFAGSRVATAIRAKLDCEAAHWVATPQSPVILFPCRQRNDGWPILLMARLDGGLLTIVEGPASTWPVLRTMMRLPDEGLSQTQLTAQAQGFWSKPVAMASATDLEAVRTLLRSARVAASQLDHAAAEAGFRSALELQTRLFGENDAVTNEILLDLALSVSNQRRFDEADALLRRAAPIADRSTRSSDRARSAAYQGYIAANRGDFAAARTFAHAATSGWRSILADSKQSDSVAGLLDKGGQGSAEAELAHALNFEAAMMLRNDDATGAFASAGEALLIIDRVEDEPRWWKSDILLTLGEISSVQGRLSAAEAYLKGALAQRQAIFGEGPGTLKVRTALGRAYQAEQMNTSAVIAYRDAIKVARALPRDSVPFAANDLVPFAAALVDYAATIEDPEARAGLFAEGFDAFQMVRSPLADRSAALASARLSADTPELATLIRRLEAATRDQGAARLRLGQEQSLNAQERSAQVEEQLGKEIANQGRSIAATRQDIARRFPGFGQLAEPKLPTLDAVRSRLHEKEGLVTFLIGRERSFVELVRRDGVVIAPVPVGAAALQAAVLRLRKGLEVQGSSVNDFDLEVAHQLFSDLFGGIQKELAEVDRLIVVPAGPLASLPFSVLVTRPLYGADYRKASWLAQAKALTHIPSLTAFVSLRSTRLVGNQPRLMMAMGNPVLGPVQSGAGQRNSMAAFTGSCLSGGVTPPQLLRSLASLPDTAGEINSVARSLKSSNITIRLGQDANEAALRGENLADYRILYFATHGLLPGELRCQSEPGLVLTPPASPAASHESDGLLDSSEISKLSISADLVVLSACNTAAAGDNLGGESLSGLAASFFHAGARSLVVSHWQVPSAATRRLMSGMFGAMGAEPDLPADTALQRAQLDMIRDPAAAHPFFWAAFVIMGDGATRPLQTRTGI